MIERALFLDFDGVLCDSIDECFVTSWLVFSSAFAGSVVPAAQEALSSGSNEVRRAFERYRPFVRRGADYVLLQDCIARGVLLESQDDFDREVGAAGAEWMEGGNDRFYAVRRELLDRDSTFWVTLNRPYAGLPKPLSRASANPWVHIISTKRSEYIAEILASWGVSWPTERLHHAGKQPKGRIILNLLEEMGSRPALLIDDQIDHLLRLAAGVEGRLAAWGYVKPEWLSHPDVRTIQLDDLITLLDEAGLALD